MRYLIFVSALALAAAGIAYAAAKPPITAKPLGAAQVVAPFATKIAKGSNLVFVQVTVEPGASFGWHIHRSAVAVAVVSGTLTLYDSSDPACAAQAITAGHGFFEAANHVHLARNEGSSPVHVLVAYLGAPPSQQLDRPAQQPAQCTGVN
jgi:quercetin dioxygenase-like cupin family protein